jgi:hypothetical protein
LQPSGFDVGENARPELDTITDSERVGVWGAFIGAGEHVQAAKDYFAASAAIPVGKIEGSAGEGEVDADADHFGHGIEGRASIEQVLIPVGDGPMVGSGGGKAGEGEGRGQHVLPEARVLVFGVEGVDEERRVGLDGSCAEGHEARRVEHFARDVHGE